MPKNNASKRTLTAKRNRIRMWFYRDEAGCLVGTQDYNDCEYWHHPKYGIVFNEWVELPDEPEDDE